MKPTSPKTRLVACLFALVAALSVASAQQHQPVAGLTFPPMALSARVQSDTIWIGEPVALRCRIVNWLGADLSLVGNFNLRGRDLEIRIVDRGEPRPPYWGPYEPNPTTPDRIALRYAKAYEYSVTLLYDPDRPSKLALDRPGRYAIQARHELSFIDHMIDHIRQHRFVATAQTPLFEVVEPPAAFTGALEILKRHPAVLIDMQQRYASAANWDLLAGIVEKYPESRYAPWCLDAMARLSAQIAPGNPIELRRARDLFQKLVDGYPDYAYHDEARIALADTLYQTGHIDRAVEIARSLIAEDEGNLFRFRESTVMAPMLGPRISDMHRLNEVYWYLFPDTDTPQAWFQRSGEELPRRNE